MKLATASMLIGCLWFVLGVAGAQDRKENTAAKPRELVLAGTLTALQQQLEHEVELQKGRYYGIDLQAPGWIAAAQVDNALGKRVTTLAGFSTFTPQSDGRYRLRVVAPGGSCGDYRIILKHLLPLKPIELALPADGLKFDEDLTKEDSVDPVRGKVCKLYEVKLEAGKTYVIDMISGKFDAFLRLESATGQRLLENDDGGGDTHARITYRAVEAGTYRIIASTYGSGTGRFTLKVVPQK